MLEVKHGNHIKLTYSGNGNYTATWHGWPSDGHKIVRRKISLSGYDHGHKSAALEAAQLFAAWLETGPLGDKGLFCRIESIVSGQTSNPDVTAILVSTDWV